MAFFKFRKDSGAGAAVPAATQSIEAIRQRAKYRLAGATLLVLLGVIGFPLLFDKQPRPIAVDTPIDIPDKNKVLPLVLPAPGASAASAVPAAPASAAVGRASDAVMITETAEPVKPAKPTKLVPMPAPVLAAPALVPPVPVPLSADAARAQALLEAKAPLALPASDTSPAKVGRLVVQVGAFADNARAHEVRLKLESAGMKTYTQVADTKDGRRIRVRVGPFDTKADADSAAAKIKKLSLPAVVLTL